MRVLILLILVACCLATIKANSSNKKDHLIENSCDDGDKNAKGNDRLNKDDKKKEDKRNDDKKNDDKKNDDKKNDDKKNDDKKNDDKKNDDKKNDDNKVKDDKKKDNDKKNDDKKEDDDKKDYDKNKENDKRNDDDKIKNDKKKQDKKNDDDKKKDDIKKTDNENKKEKRKNDNDKENNDGKKKDNDEKRRDDHDKNKRDDKKKHDDKRKHDHNCKPDEEQPNCPQLCPFYVQTFCTLPDGWCGEPRSFGNPCLLEVYNCENPRNKYKYFHDGECLTPPASEPDCGLIDCPFDYTPFCGLPVGFCGQPRTFSNKCDLEVYNCFNPTQQYTYFHDGECLAPEPDCGLIDCPFDYTPFCGLPVGFCGPPRTFSNKCDLEVYNCFNPTQQYEYFHDGECLAPPVPESDCSTLDSCDDQEICSLPNGFCGEPKTFSNKCDLEVYNTFNPTEQYEYFHDGACLTQPDPEPDCSTLDSCNDQEICGLPNGFCGEPKTFSNKCDLKVYNTFNPTEQYEYFHDGACLTQPDPEPDCSTLDSCNDQEICGLPNGFCGEPKTFSNKCDLEVYNTFNPTEQYEYFHDGACLTQQDPEPDCSSLDSCNDQEICGLPNGFCGEPKTFSNKCDLEVYNTFNPTEQYEYFHDGACFTQPDPEPDCTTLDSCNDQEICGLPNGFCGEPKTFSNKCDLEVYNTFNPTEQYEYLHDGACLTQPDPEPDCSTLDSCNDQEICGLPNGFCGEPKTFSNKCDLEVYNTFNPTEQYEYFHDGACLTQPDPELDCSTLDSCGDQKICGLPDGFCGLPKTFSNACDLEVYNTFNPSEQYEYFHDGECLTKPAPEPDCSTLDSCGDDPICGLPVDFCGKPKTFSNACDLQVYNNFNPNEKYELFHNGECLDTTIPEPEPECNIVCLDSYNPICTLPDDFCGKPRTFNNECSLNAYNCKNKNQKYKKFHDGQCKTDNPEPECNTICPAIYLPVCTLPDGICGEPKTFSSACVLASENCLYPNRKYKYFHDGECLPKPSVCPTVCTDDYAPICGTGQSGDLRRFSNKCEFDMYNCLNTNKQYTFAYDGECNECSDLMCNKIGMLVCATNFNNELRTFGNPCELQRHNCENPSDQYEYSYDGACMDNPIVCTKEYMPVCAISCSLGSKTFPNKCEQDNYISQHPDEGYSYAYNGDCASSCKLGCPRIYAPVCGRNCSGNLKEFSNQCVFEAHNCEKPTMSYAKLYDGQCNQCNDICPENYDPFCAVDSLGNELTFGNQCELDRYNCQNPDNQCTKSYNGECNQCNTMCTENYEPFCAADAGGNEKTFGNQCELDSYNCQNQKNQYEYSYDGACMDNPIVCTKEYMPVCAISCSLGSKTFPNKCEQDNYISQHPDEGYSYAYNGDCASSCKLGCPRIYAPVCGRNCSGNLKEFSNQCVFEAHNCEKPTMSYAKLYDGQCNQCNDICPENYDPFCAVDSLGNELTFGNQCELDRYNCQNPDNQCTKSYNGECNQCNTMCTENYEPFCAADAGGNEKTFGNQCELDSYNCQNQKNQFFKLYDGNCKPKCMKLCPNIMAPVCGEDSYGNNRTFNNQCEMGNSNCENPDNEYKLAYSGRCKPACNNMCTYEYNPVCGIDSKGKTQTFGNRCSYESYICNHPEEGYTLLSESECKPDCVKGCQKIYKPVCGTDPNGKTRTFSNQCELDNYNCLNPNEKCTYSKEGECEPVCSDICPAIYKPVCGSTSGRSSDKDAQTFSNECALNAHNCRNPKKKLIKASDGECAVNCKTLKCEGVNKEEKWICAIPNGFKGKPSSFYNNCERLLHNCANPSNKYDYQSDGKCDNGL